MPVYYVLHNSQLMADFIKNLSSYYLYDSKPVHMYLTLYWYVITMIEQITPHALCPHAYRLVIGL